MDRAAKNTLRMYKTSVASVRLLYIAKVERKGRTSAEELSIRTPSLDDVFLQVTGTQLKEDD